MKQTCLPTKDELLTTHSKLVKPLTKQIIIPADLLPQDTFYLSVNYKKIPPRPENYLENVQTCTLKYLTFQLGAFFLTETSS